MKRLWDISPPLAAGSPVFPGDTPYRQQWTATMGPGCPVNVSQITTSPHAGAHADAPLHYAEGAAAIGAVDLHPYLGPCRVVHCIGVRPLLRIEHLAAACDDDTLPPRVLVRTFQQAPVQHWVDDFAAFAPETLEWLADRGVQLVGLDTASVDPADSKTLDAHQVLRLRDLRVLENLVLDAVPAGDYELIALPLKLVEADASPVRAVLREL
ncbi:arylformamidase [Caldimonas brevitalea]|uniref:Kynurenine formamidase n=1 Tax=Caldimonas brevitalea TaxID=413882 RepID=A0A0G3BM55_9BURK|nr:arylformamidase [Caldimonas brevitalea]AKJ30487.1 kynurenine formamidase [Caldimonas brevitalea]